MRVTRLPDAEPRQQHRNGAAGAPTADDRDAQVPQVLRQRRSERQRLAIER